MEAGFERKKETHTELAAVCSQAGWRAFAYPVEVVCTGSTPRLLKSLEVTGSKLRMALKDRAEEVEQGYSWLLALQKGQGMGKARILGLA
ncbi:unnamed protein product [Merluccius merluccius]